MFADRQEAGRMLATRLRAYRGARPIVLGLPRGGVVVAREVADALDAPLDVVVARKIGAPGYAELAIGAVTASGTRVLHDEALRRLFIPPGYLEDATEHARKEAQRRERVLRGDRPPPALAGRTAILVDDGIATGMTMLAAIQDVRAAGPARLVVAAPVGAPDTLELIEREADELVVLAAPPGFRAVGEYYYAFDQTEDAEVQALLATPGRRS
ncbi:MAG: phosphoribosyltransferase [Cyanobacteria bacterium RYN_339]|nr:phosphoribosyltransferase [Cyanobacteria bacterium RYN_339]